MRNHQHKYLISAKGAFLLEVLLAISMSLLMISSLTAVYISMHKTQIIQNNILHQLTVAQKIISIFDDEIEKAGRIGCARLNSDFVIDPYLSHQLSPKNSLVITEKSMIVRYQAFPGAVLTKSDSDHSTLFVDSGVRFHQDEILLISDCTQAEIFQAAVVRFDGEIQIISAKTPLHNVYQPGAEIGRLVSHQYSLERSPGRSCLIRVDNDSRKVVISEDIENLNFVDEVFGITYRFTTTSNKVMNEWVGYAEKT